MYKINDYVSYEGTGICKIVDISTKKINDIEKDYYTLKPVYSNNDLTIYSCVENADKVMRKPIDKEAAIKLIKNITNIEAVWSDDCRIREMEYKEILKSEDFNKIIGMLKGLYIRKQDLSENGKKLAMNDKRNFEIAERLLHEELAIALDIELDEINSYIEAVVDFENK